jgi:hypothetical protein
MSLRYANHFLSLDLFKVGVSQRTHHAKNKRYYRYTKRQADGLKIKLLFLSIFPLLNILLKERADVADGEKCNLNSKFIHRNRKKLRIATIYSALNRVHATCKHFLYKQYKVFSDLKGAKA